MPLKARDVIDATDPRVAQIGHPAPPWLINYADLMTELVCFFIILYSLSGALQKSMTEVDNEIKEMIQNKEISGDVKYTEQGLQISLTEGSEKPGLTFFESGKSELTSEAKQVIDKIVPNLIKLPNDIIIEGHTDDVPINTAQFKSNWELSTARATNVVKYLISEKNFPPQKLSAIGYGEYKPAIVVDEKDPLEEKIKKRTRNRRVVFLVKNLSQEKIWEKSDKIKKAEKKEK